MFSRVLGASLNLIVIVIKSHNIGTGKLCNLSSRTSYTTSYIEDSHSLLDAHHMSQVVFVTSNGLVKRFGKGVTTEVE